jgi:2-oxoglutarate dehydrogenase E1 component
MAHRGRLNVLANIMGKTYEEIFNEFEGNEPDDPAFGDGDVKYHLGFQSQFKTDSGKEIMLRLAPNPSHLEAVDGVVEGLARAKADQHYDSKYDHIIPLLIHGDAAVAGQGIVYEVLQMSKLPGYFTGGTIHFVINNQIGFTTDFDDARSSDYCTSIAATVHAPVIHVNGDDIEAVIYVAEMAAEYRQKFNKDIFVDMVCFRRHGHNEADDPKYTQPNMYSLISKHPNTRDIYSKQLSESGEIESELAKKMDQEFWDDLQKKLDSVKDDPPKFKGLPPESGWKDMRKAKEEDFEKSPETSVTKTAVKKVVEALSTVPEGFTPLRKVDKYLKGRREIMQENKTVDWAAAELLAYGTILLEGKDVRMSGQDVKRGTFSHRHAIIYDEKTNQEYNRLAHIDKNQGRFMIYNSHLSEYGVLGFEYGYSLSSPNSLVLWEAQFGDFSNNAQCIIDQFLSSGETKWQRNSGMVLLLPHGYEGMGPEHSSARLERFLIAGAELNWVVVNITSSSNFFHALRRQLAWEFRKPLIVMSPKAMLRDKRTQSPIGEVLKGGFKEILDDPNVKDPKKVKRILFCSGKVYFNLEEKKLEDNREDIAIVRLEQLYPLAKGQFNAIVKRYPNAELYWVQEEPKNMGPWLYIQSTFYGDKSFTCVSRKASASPAVGFKKQHEKELNQIIEQAFA